MLSKVVGSKLIVVLHIGDAPKVCMNPCSSEDVLYIVQNMESTYPYHVFKIEVGSSGSGSTKLRKVLAIAIGVDISEVLNIVLI